MQTIWLCCFPTPIFINFYYIGNRQFTVKCCYSRSWNSVCMILTPRFNANNKKLQYIFGFYKISANSFQKFLKQKLRQKFLTFLKILKSLRFKKLTCSRVNIIKIGARSFVPCSQLLQPNKILKSRGRLAQGENAHLVNFYANRQLFKPALRQDFFVRKFTFYNARPQIFQKCGRVSQPCKCYLKELLNFLFSG